MPQFLAELIDAASGRIVLAPGEERHLLGACRARPGETVLLFDGKGTRARAVIVEATRGGAVLRLVGAPEPPPPGGRGLVLLQGIPSRAAFETILAFAVELGASRIVPVDAGRTTRPPRGLGDRAGRWRAVVLAAAKQCLRADLPPVDDPLPLEAAVRGIGDDAGIVLSGPGDPPLPLVAGAVPADRGLVLAVGPEGGWSAAELGLLADAGFAPASLGPLVLRCETAAAVALGIARLTGGAPPG